MRQLLRLGALFFFFLLPARAAWGAAAAQVIDSGVERVTVYSQSARVQRTIKLRAPAGLSEATVVVLPPAVLPDTIQARCQTTRIARVVVAPGQRRLPSQHKAEALIKRLERQLDELGGLQDEQQALGYELALLERLTPKTPDEEIKDARRPAGLFVEAWRRVLGWVDRRDGELRQQLLRNSEQQRLAREALLPLQLEAQRLDLAGANTLAPSVRVALQGQAGEHRLELSYMVHSVSWQPAYDLGFDPQGKQVLATYYATVRQQTGEDWEGARLHFSTGTPITLLAVPELPTWTIGRVRDFTPTPRRRSEPPAPRWHPAPSQPGNDPAIAHLQQLLAQSQAAGGQSPERVVDGPRPGEINREIDRQSIRPPEELDELQDSSVGRAAAEQPPAPPPPAPRQRQFRMETDSPAPSMAPPAPEPMGSVNAAFSSSAVTGSISTQSVAWTDVGYAPPQLDPNSPAAAAQGYTFELQAPGRHTIPAAEARRVPVLRERFAVSPRYKILPGLSDAAYLVAEVKNTTGRPILRGPANLFAGRMFSGQTQLETALPGRTIVLPLGVDDAIKVARHQQQKTASEGLVFKDEVTVHSVTVELANHHGYPVTVEVLDQLPVVLQGAKDVETRGFSSPDFSKPDKEGKVRWHGQLGAKAVRKLVFSYEIVRPKGKELRQHD